MNKNNKGFMLVEVIVTSVVIATAMISLYSTFNRLYTSYNRNISYYNIDAIYATKTTIDYLLNNDFNKFINKTFGGTQEISGTQYKTLIDNNTCFENSGTCNKIFTIIDIVVSDTICDAVNFFTTVKNSVSIAIQNNKSPDSPSYQGNILLNLFSLFSSICFS